MAFASLLGKLTGEFSLPEFLREVSAAVCEVVEARRAFVAFRGEDDFDGAAGSGHLLPELSRDSELLLFKPLMRRALEQGQPILIPNALSDGDPEVRLLARSGIRAAALLPVGHHGVIVCYDDAPRPMPLDVLGDLARLVSVALEVSRLKEEHPLDALTGALSHRFFLKRLDEEVGRATTYSRSLSLILLDLDGFQEYLVKHGRSAGDEVLRNVADLLRKTLRPVDGFSRTDGEFRIFLPETSDAGAVTLARRICKALPEGTGLTGSFGIASVPKDGDTSETLLLTARDALETARKQGGNCVCDGGGLVLETSASSPPERATVGREGRILEGLLHRVFTTDLDFTHQLDVAASFLSSAVEAERALVVALDHKGDWIAVGRDRLSEQDEVPLREVVREVVLRREPVRSMNGFPSICVPLMEKGEVIAAAYVDRRTESLSEYQVILLTAVASRLGAELGESIRLQKRREEIRVRTESLVRAIADLRGKYDFSTIVGEGPKLMEVLQIVARAAQTDAPVLVLGESGTGKELVARAIHANSRRRSGPFIVLNCAALPMTLLESELFGHVRGAFTGAVQDRHGLFESAHGGTLFLDEIAEMPLETQAKLLRAIQFGEVQHLGSDRMMRVDTRVVAATNRDLGREVQEKRFREDLFYRIDVFQIEVPPLREHLEDVPSLARHILLDVAKKMGRSEVDIEPAALELLRKYSYPGNVRELENILMRAAAVATGNTITAKDLPEVIHGGSVVPYRFIVPRTADELEQLKKREVKEVSDQLDLSFIKYCLALGGGNVSEASRLTGFNRTSLQKLLAKHQIDPSTFKK